MNKEERKQIRAEFVESVAETNKKILEVLAQNKVRGGVLSSIRKRAREIKNGTMPSNES